MGHGTGSTLVIKPRASHLSDITIGLSGSEPYTGASDYICPLQTLDFNEEDRRQIIYGQAPPGEGGRAVVDFGPLVPVVFELVIKTQTAAGRIDAYNAMQAALIDPEGGTIQYKPESVGAGVLSTYYHYLQSGPPRLLDQEGNRWDADAKSDGYYTLIIQIEFMTQPVATSDPDSPVTLTELSVSLTNWDNGVTVTASNLKGTMPALLRILARPGSDQNMGRLIMFSRHEGTLSNFVMLYEAQDASIIYPSVAWLEVADSERGDEAYMRCIPDTDANTVAQGLRFTISNPEDHEGRFAVFGVCYDGANTVGAWTHQAKLAGGNVAQVGRDDFYAPELETWALLYVGEFDLPVTPLSDSESSYDEGPFIEWYATRASGSSQFRLDAIMLVYVSDSNLLPSALDIACADEGGVLNSEKLLVENFPNKFGGTLEIAHVVAQSDGDFKRVLTTAPRGDFLTLDPAVDNLITFIQERATDVILDDDFSGYRGIRYLPVADMETDESWSDTLDSGVTAGADTSNYIEGSQGRKLVFPISGSAKAGRTELDFERDFSQDNMFTSSDFICIVRKWTGGTYELDEGFEFRFDSVAGTANLSLVNGTTGWLFISSLRSALDDDGIDWSGVTGVDIYARFLWSNDELILTADYARIEKADPDDASNPNATGSQWDFQPVGGVWTVTYDISGAGATLACLDVESGVEKSALIDETIPDDVRFRARAMAKRDVGYVGILWRAGDDTLTEGAEDCYAALLDIANDDLLVREYVAGAITQHDAPAFISVIDTWYVIGVIAKGSTFTIYATAASNLSDDDDVFSESYLLSSVTDSTWPSGKCGLMSITTLGRFDEAKIVSLQDKVIPADEIALEGEAIFRTIAPFSE